MRRESGDTHGAQDSTPISTATGPSILVWAMPLSQHVRVRSVRAGLIPLSERGCGTRGRVHEH